MRLVKFITYYIPFFILLLTSCSKSLLPQPIETNNSIVKTVHLDNATYNGKIDDDFIEFLKSEVGFGETIILTSGGGTTRKAYQAVAVMIEKDIGLIIKDHCYSACAEYLLPAAKHVEFIDYPKIGFHWDIMMLHDLTLKHAVRDLEYCNYKKSEEFKAYLYDRKNMNIDFWKTTQNKIEIQSVAVKYFENKCPSAGVSESKYQLWLPTSSTLKADWGLEFKGKTCSDSPKCVEETRERFKDKTMPFLIGDRL